MDWESEGGTSAVDRDVLVAILPTLRDWQLVQREHWYRIPVARAPRRIAADYLALYFPGAFGDWRWSIRCYAPVLRYHVCTRRSLLPQEPDHPHAAAGYYRLDLGPLEMLSHPIFSHRLRRITFLPTTLHRLLTAEELGDLWLRERPQEAMRRAYTLREPSLAYGATA